MRDQIKEIVTHECESYAIAQCGEVNNYDDVVDYICGKRVGYVGSLPPTSYSEFIEWRADIIAHLYRRIDFAKMLRDPQNEKFIFPMLHNRLKLKLKGVMNRNKGNRSIDDELKLEKLKSDGEKRTVAFKLSMKLYADKLYSMVINNSISISDSSALEQRCYTACDSQFPLDYPKLVEQLQVEDNEFWFDIHDIIKNFVTLLISSGNVSKNRYDDIDDCSLDCMMAILKQCREGRFSGLESASHLLNSVMVTCRNKLKEYYRAQGYAREKYAYLDESQWLRMESIDMNDPHTKEKNIYDSFEELNLTDIDVSNSYDVSSAALHLLLYPSSKFYNLYVDKKEKDVEIVVKHYIEDMSYDDIAKELYGEATTTNKATLRQRNRRTVEWLKSRLIQLVNEYRAERVVAAC